MAICVHCNSPFYIPDISEPWVEADHLSGRDREHEPEPEDLAMAMTFRVLAVIGLLTLLASAGIAIHAVTYWYSGGADE